MKMTRRSARWWFGLAPLLALLMMSPTDAQRPVDTPAVAWSAKGSDQTFAPVILPTGQRLMLGASTDKGATNTAHLISDDPAKSFDLVLHFARSGATASVLPDGRVLIWGGRGLNGLVVDTGEWFDPRTQSISDAADVHLLPRTDHTATVLTDGRLLITGGLNDQLGAMTEAELWDSRTNSSELLTSELSPPRNGHSATLLGDGRVLILGGYDESQRTYARAALFDPDQISFIDIDDKTSKALISAEADGHSPTLAGSIPKPDAEDFPSAGLIALRFSTRMEVLSLSARTVTLIGPTGLTAIHVTPADNGRVAFVTPDEELLPNSRYTLFVDGAYSFSGKTLAALAIGFGTARLGVDAQDPQGSAGPDPTSEQKTSSSTSEIDKTKSRAAGSKDEGAVATSVTVSAGSPSAIAAFQSSCTNTRAVRAYVLCRDSPQMDNGAWLPGYRNTERRWRLNTKKPDVLTAQTIPASMIAPRTTQVYGTVLRLDDSALAGATVAIGSVSTTTDTQGRFVLRNPPLGTQDLVVKGATANHADIEYGQFVSSITVKDKEAVGILYNIYIPRITALDKVHIPSPAAQETILTHAALPGLEIHIPAGTVIRDRDGKVVTDLAIVPTPVDRSPVPLPDNFPVYFTIQPGGVTVQNINAAGASGIRIVYPNYSDKAVASIYPFWAYNPDGDGWQVYATGQAINGGAQIAASGPIVASPVMPFGYGVEGPPPPPKSPKCNGHQNGDPVDCYTGLFLHSRQEFFVNDVLPIDFTRTYQSSGSDTSPFGTGGSHSYAMYLYNPTPTVEDSQEIDLVLPSGVTLPFYKTAGTGLHNGVWTHTSTPSRFYAAEIRSPNNGTNILGYTVNLKDGLVYWFPAVGSILQGERDRFGNAINLTYDAGLLSTITSPAGRYLSLTYDGENHISTVADHTGRTIQYSYDAADLLHTVTYPDSTSEVYTYDTNGDMLTVQDRRGTQMVANQYDSNRRVHVQTLAEGGVFQFAYTTQPDGTVTASDVTDPRGFVEHTTFNASGYPLSIVRAYGDALAQGMTYERQAISNFVTASTDALGRRTEYAYDIKGNVTQVTALAGTVGATAYELTYTPDYNQVASYTDPLSHTTTFDYTAGCLTKRTDPLGDVQRAICNALGQPTRITDANNNAVSLAYNTYNNDLRSISNSLGRATTFTTDSLGRVISTADPLGSLTRVEYDSNDRVVKSYDAFNRSTVAQFDGNGNLVLVTDPNNGSTHFGYDGRNRRTSRTDALNAIEKWTYDVSDHIQTFTDRKLQLTQYQYDSLGRQTLATFADASTMAYIYDTGNRLTQVNDSLSGSLIRTYDLLERLTQEQSPQGVVSYTYDTGGRRLTMTAGSQAQITYKFDDANRLRQIKQGTEVVGITYDDGDRRQVLTLPNGISVNYGFDIANQLTAMTYKNASGSTLGTLLYGYDNAGRRVSQTGTWASDVLPTATAGGNLFNLNNAQTSANGVALTYDANGNLTGDGVRTYVWDARNRLTSVMQSGLTMGAFTYDVLGRRTTKTLNGTLTNILYDGLNPVQEASGLVTRPILSGGVDEFFARSEAGGRRYMMSDAMGSTIALTDAAQTVQATYRYEPFGEVVSTGSSDNPYQYTGRDNDGTGLYYYRARYYSPRLKRFISEDPLGLVAGANEYSYVYDSPTNGVDPDGQFAWILAGAAIGGVLNAGGNLAVQLWMNDGHFSCVNWSNVGWSFVTGAAGGALMTTGLGTTALGVAGIGAGTNLANYGLTTNYSNWSAGGAAVAAGVGAAGGMVGGAFKNPYMFYEPNPFNPNPSMFNANTTASALGRATAGAATSSYTGDSSDCDCQ